MRSSIGCRPRPTRPRARSSPWGDATSDRPAGPRDPAPGGAAAGCGPRAPGGDRRPAARCRHRRRHPDRCRAGREPSHGMLRLPLKVDRLQSATSDPRVPAACRCAPARLPSRGACAHPTPAHLPPNPPDVGVPPIQASASADYAGPIVVDGPRSPDPNRIEVYRYECPALGSATSTRQQPKTEVRGAPSVLLPCHSGDGDGPWRGYTSATPTKTGT